MPVYHSIVHARTLSEVEAWTRLGWQVVGHAWDNLGSFTTLGQIIRR